MPQHAVRMSMDEGAARRVILAHAIETADAQGKLLSNAERDEIDRQARHDAGADEIEPSALSPQQFLDLRARRVIQAVQARDPDLAELQYPWHGQRWAAHGLPLGAMLLGVLTDVVANPHRVDLVSLPLLGLVLWNLAVYLLLLAGWSLSQRRAENAGPEAPRHRRAASLLRWRRGSGNVRADATALFHLRWQLAARALTVQRGKRILHLAAAGWAVGVSLSLLARGLVVEYRVGWESTFLDATQVHAILSILRLPALLLFPFQPFTVQEVAALQFGQGAGAIGGARWVYMYVALLLVVVVLPRLVLAATAFWHERAAARKVVVDTRDAYYRRVVSLLGASRVQLCVVTHRAQDRAALSRVLVQQAEPGRTLITSPQGDVLRLADLSGIPVPPVPAQDGEGGWLRRLLRNRNATGATASVAAADPILAGTRDEGNVVLHVVRAAEDLESASPLLGWLGRPVLVLVNRAPGEPEVAALLAQCAAAPAPQAAAARVLPFDSFARCWVQEPVLLEAIAACLPEAAHAGFERIAAAWDERNRARFGRAMVAIAEHLLYAARQVQEVRSAALTVKVLLPGERQAQAQARQAAMDEVVKRLHVSAGELFSRLRVLHGLDEAAAGALQHRIQQRFVVQRAVDTPQAGMAGAATGAAMGASVDLLVGGLTLGAATALGALVGGGAATIAAAWRNRSTGAGTTVVQLSDEMLQALTEAALLRYLAVAHDGRGDPAAAGDLTARWTADVAAAVQAHREQLASFWVSARTQPDAGRLAVAVGRELEATAREVLERLYPPPERTGRSG